MLGVRVGDRDLPVGLDAADAGAEVHDRVVPEDLGRLAVGPLAEGRHGLPRGAGEERGIAVLEDLLVGLLPGAGALGGPGEAGEGALEVAEPAVVAPHREEQVLEARLAAGVDARAGGGARVAVVVPEGAPRPDAGRHDRLAVHRAVRGDHLLVERGVLVVVVPVAEADVVGDLRGELGRALGPQVVVVAGLRGGAEPHVAPHLGVDADLAAHVGEALDVLQHDVEDLLLAEALPELALAEAPGLVEPEVDRPRADVLVPEAEHLLDEDVALLLPREEDAVDVAQRLVGLPAEDLLEVAERLEAGHELDAERGGVVVDRADVGRGEAAAQHAEVGLARQLVDVLGVEHRVVVAEDGEALEAGLGVVDRHHGVAREVDHHAEPVERAALRRGGALAGDETAEEAERVAHAGVADRQAAGGLGDRRGRGGVGELRERERDRARAAGEGGVAPGEDLDRRLELGGNGLGGEVHGMVLGLVFENAEC